MARRTTISSFEIGGPLHICLPLPVRRNAGPMEVESTSFDGRIVRVIYRKYDGESMGWWYGQAVHDIEYLPSITTIDAAIAHAESKGGRYDKGRSVRNGAGWSIRLSPLKAAGGNNWIYVVTPRGALRIPDS
jgi:hypothetical protein